MTKITYGRFEIDTADLPETSVAALLRRGVAHYFGNEVAAKVTNAKAKFEKENEGAAASDEQVEAWKVELQDKAFDALVDGTVGTSVARGPAADPLEAKMAVVARENVLVILAANKIKAPKKGESIKFGNATMSMEDLVARQIAKNGDSIKAEAERRIAEDARKRAAKAEIAKATGTDVEALGL